MGISWANKLQLLLGVSWWFGGLEAPAGAQNVLCYGTFDATAGTCNDLLGDGVTQDDCCLNHRYGFQLGRNAPCQACQVAEWSGWSPWSACSVSCREGVQRRSRTCHGRASGGTCQEGSRQWEMQTCSLMACCPVVGGWSAWNAWSACSVTCLRGLQTRERTCTNPVPDCGGTCLGSSTETLPCDTQQICPTHGNWGSWGNWEACPSTCIPEGSAPKPRQQRRRQCNSPPPSRDPLGNRCQGDDQEHRPCSGLPSCPLDGRWTEWSAWNACERRGTGIVIDCDELTGIQKRTRMCAGRAHNGMRCAGGLTIEVRTCYSIQSCKMDGTWTNWSPWGLCEPPCAEKPMRSRKRECKPIYPNYSMTVAGESGKVQNVSFWGTPKLKCDPLGGQMLKVVEQVPCQNVLPCEG
ncbi:properdin isoform X2 [Rhineura floridana]|uniref:properdin isoform X2 n=1 Tax=Rhineura floridana TaxID=261503 RepID=UPI002AC830B2|nr:properdin isoform X2 [Rhineura floridana]